MNPFAGLITPMQDRPCVARSEQMRHSPPPPQWPPRKWKRLDVPEVMNPWDLTPMQCEVMNLRIQGTLQRVIADKLGISHKTVWSHLDLAQRKMEADSKRHAVNMWDRWVRAHRGDV